MKECKVKMEITASEIQVESKDEKRPTEVSPQDEKQEGKASMLCFKRRKKAAKAVKPKAGSKAADAARKRIPETEASDQLQPSGGAWASIKRLVTRKKRSDSKQQSLEAKVQPEINAEDADLSKKKVKSRLKIPCIKFSKGEKRSDQSKIIEDSDYSIKVQGEAESLDTKTPTRSDDQTTKTKLTQPINEVVSQKDDEICESKVSNSETSGENMISVELGIDMVPSAIQTGAEILEEEVKTTEEKQSVQPQQASLPPETSEAEHQPPVASDVTPASVVPDQQTVEEDRSSIPESGLNCQDHESREIIVEESKPNDTELSQETDSKENEISEEKPNPEESKRMEPIAIIITDTEISEFDVKKSKNVPKQFLISIENEQVGFFANDSGFESRTSEQYETLLIETASSLVKNAIQLSIEQLVNEMVSDDNKINNLLQ
ncbi:A-kinase anchor protein 5 [Galemys pyrenaicus]|uniref:A-kinase anchor protein 5 n=1 Tax=Galemys pyrenaicus TaxID=202257 RepID=A0A8J6AHW3_GALPY|nr:A-kinase anchor protein 5 [Galemys pyrenaicus]